MDKVKQNSKENEKEQEYKKPEIEVSYSKEELKKEFKGLQGQTTFMDDTGHGVLFQDKFKEE